MIEIKRFAVNMLQENCYVVSDETKECVIIDCGAFYDEDKEAIETYITENRLQPKLLCTLKKQSGQQPLNRLNPLEKKRRFMLTRNKQIQRKSYSRF